MINLWLFTDSSMSMLEPSQLGNESSLPAFGESWGVAAVVVIIGGSYGVKDSSLSGSSLPFSRTDPL